jgi:uncharacterized protein YoxC
METQDILNTILAVAIGVFTVFLCLFFYYLILIVRDLRKTTKTIHERVEEIGTILHAIKERVADSASALSMLANVISNIAGKWKQKRSKRSKTESGDEIDDA